jgi:5,10-methylenetetrahydromethanopterin reductase
VIGIELTPEYPLDRVVDLAERAEDAGYDAVFTSCHYNNRDPFQALARIAKRTDGVALGPGVANPYETHPVALAARVATLDEGSGGRAICGIGAGDRSTLRALDVTRDAPLNRVRETMEVARALWRGEQVTHDGTFAATDAALNFAERVRDDLPVYVGGQGPDMLRMAAKHADGALINGSHPDDLAWAAERIAEGRAARTKNAGPFRALAYASVSVAADAEAARSAARPPVSFIAGSAAAPVLERHGIDRERAAAIGEAIETGRFTDAFDAVTPAMVDAFAAAGTVDTVADRLASLLEHVDGIVVGAPLGPDLERAVSLARGACDRAGAA